MFRTSPVRSNSMALQLKRSNCFSSVKNVQESRLAKFRRSYKLMRVSVQKFSTICQSPHGNLTIRYGLQDKTVETFTIRENRKFGRFSGDGALPGQESFNRRWGVTDTPTRYDDTRSNGKIFTAFYRLSYTTTRRVPVACVDYYSFESPVDYIVPNILIGRRAPDFECTTAAVRDGTTPRPAVTNTYLTLV